MVGILFPGTLRSDPYERHYRIRLLSRMMASNRWSSQGCKMRALRSQALASLVIRSQFIRVFWLHRRRVPYHYRTTWVGKAPMASQFPGIAWHWKDPLTTEASQHPCSTTGSCIRFFNSLFTCFNFPVNLSQDIWRRHHAVPIKQEAQNEIPPVRSHWAVRF